MEKHSKNDTYKILLTMVTGFLIIALLAKKHPWLIYLPLSIGLVAFVSETAAGYMVDGWMKLAEVLGKINSGIILSAIFFLFLTPMAWLYKLSGKTKNYFRNSSSSTFNSVNKKYAPADIKNMW